MPVTPNQWTFAFRPAGEADEANAVTAILSGPGTVTLDAGEWEIGHVLHDAAGNPAYLWTGKAVSVSGYPVTASDGVISGYSRSSDETTFTVSGSPISAHNGTYTVPNADIDAGRALNLVPPSAAFVNTRWTATPGLYLWPAGQVIEVVNEWYIGTDAAPVEEGLTYDALSRTDEQLAFSETVMTDTDQAVQRVIVRDEVTHDENPVFAPPRLYLKYDDGDDGFQKSNMVFFTSFEHSADAVILAGRAREAYGTYSRLFMSVENDGSGTRFGMSGFKFDNGQNHYTRSVFTPVVAQEGDRINVIFQFDLPNNHLRFGLKINSLPWVWYDDKPAGSDMTGATAIVFAAPLQDLIMGGEKDVYYGVWLWDDVTVNVNNGQIVDELVGADGNLKPAEDFDAVMGKAPLIKREGPASVWNSVGNQGTGSDLVPMMFNSAYGTPLLQYEDVQS